MDYTDDLVRAIGRMEGKLDSLVDLVKAHIEEDDVRARDQAVVIRSVEKRVGSLERWRAYLVGIGVAGGAAGSSIWKYLGGS